MVVMIGMREAILKELAEKNTLLTPGAWKYLDSMDKPLHVVRDMINSSKELPFPVGRDCLVSFVETAEEPSDTPVKVPTKSCIESLDVDIVCDITGNSLCTGELSDFTGHFLNRYEKLRTILSRRREAKGVMNIRSVKKRKGDARIIAMVSDVSTTSNGNKFLTLEDPTGMIRGFVSSESEAFEQEIIEDEVIIAIGRIWEKKNGYDTTLSIDNIVRPSVPKNGRRTIMDFDGKVAFISDIHIGSTTFLKDKWENFLNWMESGTDGSEDIRYLVIAGDLIDGIGIYPNQEDELEIKDVYEQYRVLGEMMKRIPSHIKVITIPGNHDIVRNMEPQPALTEKVQKMFPKNVTFCGNPSMIRIGELKILAYHGGSINDLSDLLADVDSDEPCTAMREMLERRHLVPVYGKKTPIAPEKEDLLVIEEVPDVFVTGHIHKTDVKMHHNTLMINASTWQDQTDYQKMRDIQPDPGKVVLYDPSTKKAKIKQC